MEFSEVKVGEKYEVMVDKPSCAELKVGDVVKCVRRELDVGMWVIGDKFIGKTMIEAGAIRPYVDTYQVKLTARNDTEPESYGTTFFESESVDRKQIPLASGLLDYFPDALAAVAHCSWVGNEQHNPGEPLHWSREKSSDHADCLMRHLAERGTVDSDGVRHAAKVAWRALALLQLEIERSK